MNRNHSFATATILPMGPTRFSPYPIIPRDRGKQRHPRSPPKVPVTVDLSNITGRSLADVNRHGSLEDPSWLSRLDDRPRCADAAAEEEHTLACKHPPMKIEALSMAAG